MLEQDEHVGRVAGQRKLIKRASVCARREHTTPELKLKYRGWTRARSRSNIMRITWAAAAV